MRDQAASRPTWNRELSAVTNAEIAAVFDQVADLLEFQGANPFRVRAYRTAARAIGEMVEPLSQWIESGRDLKELPGIGEDLSEKIAALVATGTLPLLEELKAEFPESVLSLLRVQGLGPKRAAVLYRELKVRNLEELLAACEAHRVRSLKGFGAKTEENILKGLRAAMAEAQRILWYQADQLVRDLTAHLAGVPGLRRCEPAGSYRRRKETVGDLDILTAADDPKAVMRHFERFSGVRRVLAEGTTKAAVELQAGLNADLRVIPEESFGAALQYFTGSKEHNVVLRGMAKDRGLKINEYGVFRGEERVAGEDEEGVYAAIGLPWIPPELREGRWEFDWALGEGLPELITLEDIRGDLHMHSTWTDGTATVEEMAEAAKARGYAYIAVTDHSQRVTVAGGLTPDKVLRQWEAIDRIAAETDGIRILKGIEVDILEQGGLDLPDEVLAQADWVVASVHFGQNQSRERITQRILDALRNPYVCAIAHPTGRLLGERPAYEVDLEAVLATAAECGKALELNAHPRRLDLNDTACAAAKRHGVPIVISTDAHSINGLDAMRFGVMQARRGGLTRNDVLNARPWSEFRKFLRNRD